jgi:hypothetical protein
LQVNSKEQGFLPKKMSGSSSASQVQETHQNQDKIAFTKSVTFKKFDGMIRHSITQVHVNPTVTPAVINDRCNIDPLDDNPKKIKIRKTNENFLENLSKTRDFHHKNQEHVQRVIFDIKNVHKSAPNSEYHARTLVLIRKARAELFELEGILAPLCKST